jgi:predicted nucleotidyltransferase component of viral defense system
MMNEQALKERLQKIAKETGMPFNACWKQLLLERFLVRISRSKYSNQLIFKGGFLLSYFLKIGRETIDLDFLLTKMKAEIKTLQEIFEHIVSENLEDGFHFYLEKIDLLSQPHMDYPGYRVVLQAAFAKMKDKIRVDVGIGDIVEPEYRKLQLFQYQDKPFFEDIVSLQVYPLETIFAEKLETILSKGSRNTRMKDFHDLLLILREKGLLDSKKLKKTLTKTFQNRRTPLRPIQFNESGLEILQNLWKAHLQGLGDIAKELDLPKEMNIIIEEINAAIE